MILDLKQLCEVSSVEIQWWGISWSKKYEIYICDDEEDSAKFHLVATQESATVSPRDYNEWSKLPGWKEKTRKIKFVLKEGELDPWDMNVWIGIRQIKVYGKRLKAEPDSEQETLENYLLKKIGVVFDNFRKIERDLTREVVLCRREVLSSNATVEVSDYKELAGNLIDGTDSEWWTEKKEATIEFDFQKLCRVDQIDIKWWGISYSEKYVVYAAGEDGVFKEVMTQDDAYENPSKYSLCHQNSHPLRFSYSLPFIVSSLSLSHNELSLYSWKD